MASCIVRKAVSTDCDILWEMLKDNRRVEGRLQDMILTFEDFQQDGFGVERRFDCSIAEVKDDGNTKPIGFSMVYPVYSGTVGKSLHIEEIYIKEQYRGRGYGSVLFKHVAKSANNSGCNLMTWGVFVTPWNEKTISFYKKFDAEDHDVHIFSLNKESLKKYADFDSSL